MTLSDIQGRLLLLSKTFRIPIPLNIQQILTTICLHMNRIAHMACNNFNCLIEAEELLKVKSQGRRRVLLAGVQYTGSGTLSPRS